MSKDIYRVADYVADFIADKGVADVFLLPGGGAMHLIDAVGKSNRLKAVACLHEQAAAIAAEAYSRVNENIGVAMVTTGPGATNAITAVAGAWIESVPLMIISGQVKRPDMLRGRPLRQSGVQEVDIVSIVKSVTKYAVTIMDSKDIRMEMEKAYELSRSGRAGPVWIDVPLDVQGAPIEMNELQGWSKEELDDNTQLKKIIPEQLTQLESLLAEAERPLVLAGHGIRLAGGAKKFRRFIDQLKIPVVTTWNAMDLLTYDNPLNIGKPGVVALRAPNFAIQNCDLLISIGCRLDNIITAYNPRGFARDAKKVVVDVDFNEIDKLDLDISLSINADAAEFLDKSSVELNVDSSDWNDWRDRCESWKIRYSLQQESRNIKDDKNISSYALTECLSELIPEDVLVSTGSSGLAIEAFYTVYKVRARQRVFLTSGLGAMGYGLPAAIGACFANGRKPMVAVESDGSLQLNIQELATLKAFDLPICLVIMNNNGYASIRNTQRNYFKSRFVGTGPEAGLFLPELNRIAETYEIVYRCILNPQQLREELANAIDFVMIRQLPIIVDVHIMENETLEPKVAALPQADGSMLSMPLEDMSPLLPIDVLEKEMIVELSSASFMARQSQ